MKFKVVFALFLLMLPTITLAAETLQSLAVGLGTFINQAVIPLIFGIALLFFLWNVVRYFIIGGANEEDRAKAKRLALWAIIAFVLMVSIWGIVNLLVGGLGFDRDRGIIPDYICRNYGGSCGEGP